MTKKLWLTSIIIFSLLFTACENKEDLAIENKPISMDMTRIEVGNDTVEKLDTILDYYPFVENQTKYFKGIGSEYAEASTFVEFADENKAQIKTENPGTFFVKILEYKNNELVEVYTEGEFYHIENMLSANRNNEDILIKEPLEVGNKWESGGIEREITSLNAKVSTDIGDYEAMEVTSYYETGATEKNYYAKDMGHIKSLYKDGDMEVISLLEKVVEGPKKYDIRAYYPDEIKGGKAVVERELQFKTNDNVDDIIENILKDSTKDGYTRLISEDTNINRLSLNRNSWILEIDFSKDLTADMNLGSDLEGQVLECIVKTLGELYDVDKIYITVEGKPYESGHYSMDKGN